MLLLECHVFKSRKLPFSDFNVDGEVPPQFYKFVCSTVYSLSVINRTGMLVSWYGYFFPSSTLTAAFQHQDTSEQGFFSQMLSHGQKSLGPRLDMTIHVLFKLSVSELITETIVSLCSLSPEIVL